MIGSKIYKMRKKRDLTLSELAEKAHISKSYLSNLERNINKNPSIQIVKQIANALAVDFRVLVGINATTPEIIDDEWNRFINNLRDSGVKKTQIEEYKLVLEFAKWKKEHKNEQN